MKDKKLIFEDPQYPVHLRHNLKHFKPFLDKLKEAYNNLELGPFNNDVFKELIERGTAGFKAKCEEKIKTELNKAGIKNKAIINSLTKDNLDNLPQLNAALEDLKKTHPFVGLGAVLPSLRLENISYSEGEFGISDEELESLMEKNGRVYIETPEEHELHESLEEFIEAYHNVNKVLEGAGLRKADDIRNILTAFLKKTDEGYDISPRSLRWNLHTKPEMDAKRQKKTEERAAINRQEKADQLAYEAARMKNIKTN